MIRNRLWAAAVLVAVISGLIGSTAEWSSRDRAADGRDWPSYGGGPNAGHYSPLDQINTANVGQLGLAWSYDLEGVPNAITEPVEVDGVLYFAAGFSVVHALDARTGKLLWRHDPEVSRWVAIAWRD